MSHNSGLTPVFTEEWLAAQSPELPAVIRHLLAEIAQLKEQVSKLTPQNSSLPPSSQHPHAKPLRSGSGDGHERDPLGCFADGGLANVLHFSVRADLHEVQCAVADVADQHADR